MEERASGELGTKDGATVVTNDDDADKGILNEVEGGDIGHTEGDSAAAYHIPIDESDLVKMSRYAIKKELSIRGQWLSGNKGELLGGLRKALEDKVVGGSKKKSKKKSTKKISDGESGLGTFSDSAYWRILDKDDQATNEPDNVRFKTARAPTIGEADAKFVPVKYGFSKYSFDRG